MKPILTLGPCLFNWKIDDWKDFYFKIADESDFEEVYLGEVICSRRLPAYDVELNEVAERLKNSGKKVIRSTLALIMNEYEEKALKDVCENTSYTIEANDVSALSYLKGRSFYVGPFINTYNENTAQFMAAQGASRLILPFELSKETVEIITRFGAISTEVQAFGRLPLAISSRCYHARAHNLRKSKCGYVCNKDYDGMEVKTLDGQPFLNVNGTCTMSHSYVNLSAEFKHLHSIGVSAFRISPQNCDMLAVNKVWRQLVEGKISPKEADALLLEITPDIPYSNGFLHNAEGREYLSADPLE